MTARDVLAEIEQRAKDGPVSDWCRHMGDEPHHRVIDRRIQFDKQMSADQIKLVAALRAVLDLHRPMTKSEADILDLDAGDCFDCWQETPCDTARTITDALNGVTAGTDR